MTPARARRGGILAASLAIYLVWGSAYLAMRIGLATIPPLLVGPSRLLGAGRVNVAGAIAITLASLSWAVGSIYTTRARMPCSAALAGGMAMLWGSGLLLVAAAVGGELRGFHPAQVSRASLLAIGFLVVFSSSIGFSCYLWLLKVASPARVSTYGYINPLVAVGLGWAVAGEAITPRMVAAMALLLSGVVLIVGAKGKGGTAGKTGTTGTTGTTVAMEAGAVATPTG